MRRCANLKTLEELLSHERGEDARQWARTIRSIWKAADARARVPGEVRGAFSEAHFWPFADTRHPPGYVRRWCIDWIAGFHGVEYLGTLKRTGEPVEYCNAGDPYARTILFIGDRLTVGCWGDLVERDAIREGF